MQTFEDYKGLVASEKITLVVLEASKRLIGFSSYAGDVYALNNFDTSVITVIKDSGNALTEVQSIASIAAGTYFNDKENQILYIQTASSAHPNSKFIHLTYKLFFANAPVTAPYDLNSGHDVYWDPSLSQTSDFGVEIDTVNQQNETIEGNGSVKLHNDQEFWPANFDKLFFENQNCWVYSWNRDLAPTEAKLIFRGKIDSKTYTSKEVTFKLKDLIAQLRNPVTLNEMQALGLRTPPDLLTAKQRMIYGRVFGHRPTNVDAVINQRYPLPGTVSVIFNSLTVTGTGTTFLKHVSPDDRIDLLGTEYTVASVSNDTSLQLSEVYAGSTIGPVSVDILPLRSKRWQNRVWKLAGHALRQPLTDIRAGSSSSLLFLGSTADMYAGDFIYIGTLGAGELVTISSVINSTQVLLATSLAGNPTVGTQVLRPCIQDVQIDNVRLVFYRDYTVDADNATLTLRDTAEALSSPVRQALDQGTFTFGSRTVSGVGTNFKTLLSAGDMIRPFGSADFYEVLSVDSDTLISLRTAYADSTRTAFVQYRNLILDPSVSVLHCQALGRTLDGTKDGHLLKRAPEMVKQLLLDSGFLTSEVNSQSFVDSQELVPEELGFVVPKVYDDTTTVTYRDVMNIINKSVFGIVFQDANFQMSYDILRPVIPASPIVIKESDCIAWTVSSTNTNMISKAFVNYAYREYDADVKGPRFDITNQTSDIGKYILSTTRERIFDSILSSEQDAQRLCNRWKFLLEFSTNTVTITTKLQLIDVEINDVIDFENRKFYERFAGTSKRKFLAIQKIAKSGRGVTIECVDLSNAFNRVALISNVTSKWSDSSEDTLIQAGFISDNDGLIGNAERSFGTNLIW